MNKRTKVLIGLGGLVILVGIGLLVWASTTGNLKSRADSGSVPNRGVIEGVVQASTSKCKLDDIYVTLINVNNPLQKFRIKAGPELVGGEPHYRLDNIPLNTGFKVGIDAHCNSYNPPACTPTWKEAPIVTFAFDGDTRKVDIPIAGPGNFHIGLITRTDCGALWNSPKSSCDRGWCKNCIGRWCDCYSTGTAQVYDYGVTNGWSGWWTLVTQQVDVPGLAIFNGLSPKEYRFQAWRKGKEDDSRTINRTVPSCSTGSFNFLWGFPTTPAPTQ